MGQRVDEIRTAAAAAEVTELVPVVPVRMTEAWLLIDEVAIRISADNPNGTEPLPLPAAAQLEHVQDPKRVLHDCLLAACELGRRRQKQFRRRIGERVQRVATMITDFGPLEQLPAFRAFRQDTQEAVARLFPDV